MAVPNLPISVIVITRNAGETLEKCLGAVLSNSPAEIIVVDGNSSDRTLDIAGKYTQRIYSDNGRGKSYARQLGTEQATQKYISYVDADVILSEGALATMLAELEGSDYISISAGESPGIHSSNYWEWAQRQQAWLSYSKHTAVGIGMATCLFRRETILKYGFELSYGGHMDDIPLEIRLRQDGYRFGLSSAYVYHYHKSDFKNLVKYRFFFGQLKLYYIRKFGARYAGFWPPLYTLYWLGICLLKGNLKLIPYHMVVGAVETAGMVKGLLEPLGKAQERPK